MKRFIAILIGLLAFVALAVFGAVMVMPEDDLAALVRPLPIIGSHAETIADLKFKVNDTASHIYDDTTYKITSTWRKLRDFSFTEGTQRVVIELDPVRPKKPRPKDPPPVPASEQPNPSEPMPEEPEQTINSAAPVGDGTDEMRESIVANNDDAMPLDRATDAAAPETEQMSDRDIVAELTKEAEPPQDAMPPAGVPGQPEKMDGETAPEDMAMAPTPAEPAKQTPTEPVKPTPEAMAPASEETQKKQPEAKQPPVREAAKSTISPKIPPKKPPPPTPTIDTGSAEHKKGLTFYKGIGDVAVNFKTAAKWFRLSSAKGNAAAQYNLGIMAYLGQGEDLSYSQAAQWFRQAANQDHALAQYNLGFLYYEGKGVEKDDLQAFMWIDRAARLGDEKAIKARDTLEKILPKDLLKGR